MLFMETLSFTFCKKKLLNQATSCNYKLDLVLIEFNDVQFRASTKLPLSNCAELSKINAWNKLRITQIQ